MIPYLTCQQGRAYLECPYESRNLPHTLDSPRIWAFGRASTVPATAATACVHCLLLPCCRCRRRRRRRSLSFFWGQPAAAASACLAPPTYLAFIAATTILSNITNDNDSDAVSCFPRRRE
ncbi:hypothetical protein CGGC5_v011272 [Colletotrichum fructicola Nara gc5]|uniref:Uncharacterized protein n=1 Tax=Colletotrichum fructicola (strain Nara gc5) TaxID=1213859 RepID=A0A7J6ITW1_COLFN|nr:hypothetical protein CGGC5_v011272 [Colletotrichum fructicola Nara gc5]